LRTRTWGIITLVFLILSIISIFLGSYNVVSIARDLLNSKPNMTILPPGGSINFNSSSDNSLILVLYNTSIGGPLKLVGYGQQSIMNGKYLVVLYPISNSALYNNYTLPVTVYYSYLIVKQNLILITLFSFLSFIFIILTIIFGLITLFSWIRSRRRR